MKKIFALLALLSIIFTGCTSLEDNTSMFVTPSDNVLRAGFADNSRTYVENNKYLRWHEDDHLTAFWGNTLNRQYKFDGTTGDNSGTFSLVPSGNLETGNIFDRIYAVYPYRETVTITEEGAISLTLPAVQSYAENSFGNGANTMIAVTENLEDTFLAFKNTCGYLKLKLYNADGATLKSIEVKGNNGEKIAGAATATIQFGEVPAVTMAEDATDSVMLDCGEGVALGTTAETATEFWFVLPETTFTKGITIVAIDNLGGTYTKSTSTEVVIERNYIQPMSVLSSVFEGRQQNNQIWYTSSDGEIVTPNKTDVFGVNIVSNEYKDGKGIITFDGDVTTIGSNAFQSCKTLVTISLPETVASIGFAGFQYCSLLMAIDLSEYLVTIGGSAFYGCTKLQEVRFPKNLTSIGASAFRNCENITELTIPDNCTLTIGDTAFKDCTSMISLTIGSNVVSIDKYAFTGCASLNTIYCRAMTPPKIYYGSGKADYYSPFPYENKNSLIIYVPWQACNEYLKYSYGQYNGEGLVQRGWKVWASNIRAYIFE